MWHLSCDHFVENHSKAEDITRLSVWLISQNFGCTPIQLTFVEVRVVHGLLDLVEALIAGVVLVYVF